MDSAIGFPNTHPVDSAIQRGPGKYKTDHCKNERSPGDEVDSSQQPLLSAVLSKARKKKYGERKYQLELRKQSVTLSLFETNPRYFKGGGKYALGLR